MHIDSQKAHEKMLNITNQHCNANQNHNDILPHLRMDFINKTTNNKWWLECADKETIVEENKNTKSKRCIYLYVDSSIIYDSQDMEATKCSLIEWL